MLAESQRVAMLAAMGIDVYRLRAAPASASWRIFIDTRGRACVCGSGTASFAWLPPALGIALADLHCAAADADVPDDHVKLVVGTPPPDPAGKRALWQALKPLARRLRET
ncbi:MAG: hypothetical protein JSS28_02285 [Proteobacteria bacterium]|nr:hypothetical protein [Pseudomonadota bacterium]